MEKARIVALGGLNELGKNCYCIEVDGDIFVVECGLKYPAVNNPGIDFVIPNFDYLRKNANRVKAVIITHAHDATYGALPYLLNLINVPVYASQTTITMIRMDFQRKFRKFGNFHFVSVSPSSSMNIAGHMFHFFATTHSMPNSFGFALETEAGNIVYSSSFISDYSHVGNYSFDMPRMCRIAESRPTLLLMCESEGAQLAGTASPKHRLTPFLTNYLENMAGPMYIALYTHNFYNIQEAINAAVRFNKTIIFANPYMESFLKSFNACGDLVIPQGHFAELGQIESVPPSQRVILVTGSGLNLFEDIKDIVYGNRRKDGLFLDTSSTFIMACPSVPGTEVQHTEALDAVFTTGAKVKNITRRDIASMHAQSEDIKMMITLFRPKYYMPITGEYRQLMANAMTAVDMEVGLNHHNIFVYDNGMFIKFDENGKFVAQAEKVLANDVVVDGNTVGNVKDSVLEERATMAKDGVILMSSLISLKEKKQLSAPDIQMRGFIYMRDDSKLNDKINNIFSTTIEAMLNDSHTVSLMDIQKKVADKVQRFLKKETEKQPLVICVIRNADESERSQLQRAQARAQKAEAKNKSEETETPKVTFTLPTPRKPAGENDE